jgi:septal ring factor EnvC (AmiA/AmiB activator)
MHTRSYNFIIADRYVRVMLPDYPALSTMPMPLRSLLHGAMLILGACFFLVALAADQPASTSSTTLAEAQRRLRNADEQLERAKKDVTRAQRSLRQAEENLQAAERDVERRRTGVEEAKKGVSQADEKLAETQRVREAARAEIEKLYDAQQR